MAHLFDPLTLRSRTFSNRLWVSPMCQYSSQDGFANDWHLVHLGSRAVGGAGLVMTEASAVTPEGRISPEDLGIWKDEHIPALTRIVEFIHAQGTLAGMQLAHAGRKASTRSPFVGHGAVPVDEGGWEPLGPGSAPFAPDYPSPRAMNAAEIQAIPAAFAAAARRALAAGMDVIELHGAHGYLLHSFLSPLSNQRHDEYGGPFENRIRLVLETVAAVRAAWPEDRPLLFRISASDWVENGWTVDDSVRLAPRLRTLGVDLIDCSSGGNVPALGRTIPLGPGYQTPFAAALRQAGIPTAAVGMIASAVQAEHIVVTGQADAVFMAREMLRNPYTALAAAHRLDVDVPWPQQYERAKARR